MKLLMDAAAVEADREAWLDRRREGIGASDIGSIMRLDGAYGSPMRVWMDKTGRLADPAPPTDAMEYSLYSENFIAHRLARERPDLHVTPGGLYCGDDRPWMMATFDRFAHPAAGCPRGPGCLTGPPDKTVQLKADAGHRDWAELGIPPAYWAQVVWEMTLAAAGEGLMPVLNRTSGALDAIWVIERDARVEEQAALMIEAAERFLELVARDEPPPTDGLPATTEALKRMFGADPGKTARVPWRLAVRWHRARAACARAEKSRRRWENEIRMRIGDAGRVIAFDPCGDERLVAVRKISPRAGYQVKPHPGVDKLDPSRRWPR